jgi:xanthine/uracil permease
MGTVVLTIGTFFFGMAVREVAGTDKRSPRETMLGVLVLAVGVMLVGVVLIAGGN